MSVMFSVDGTSVWWPASKVGQLFKRQADAVAASLGIPSGLGDLFADEVVIDLPVFEEFVMRLADQYTTPYYVVKSLIEGALFKSLL